jgi:membrane protease YdiL (CAAX protease family)
MIDPGRLVVLVLALQAALAGLTVLGMWAFGLPFVFGGAADAVIGLVAAGGLAGANWWLLFRAPAIQGVLAVRRMYDETLVPLFAPLGPGAATVVGLSAGVGEELFFRGLLQPLVGLPAASVLFGAAHVAGRGMWGFGVWAALMGAALGTLAAATGGLLAPIVAHGAYDVLALTYIRRTAFAATRRGGAEGDGIE